MPKESAAPGHADIAWPSHVPLFKLNKVAPVVLWVSRIQGVPSPSNCNTTSLEVSLDTNSVLHEDAEVQALEHEE